MPAHRTAGPAQPAADPQDLLAAVGRGDGAAFDALYPLVAGPVYGLALRVLRHPELAQEVAQEALVEVWRLAPRYDPARGPALAWVLMIAHRRAVDRVRREQARSAAAARAGALHEVPALDEVPRTVERSLDAARVRRALAGLSGAQREAIELAYWRGLSHQEVSAALDIPLGTAKTRIRDGLIRLRDALATEVDRD